MWLPILSMNLSTQVFVQVVFNFSNGYSRSESVSDNSWFQCLFYDHMCMSICLAIFIHKISMIIGWDILNVYNTLLQLNWWYSLLTVKRNTFSPHLSMPKRLFLNTAQKQSQGSMKVLTTGAKVTLSNIANLLLGVI